LGARCDANHSFSLLPSVGPRQECRHLVDVPCVLSARRGLDQLDLHLDKAIRLGASGRKITLNADLFNAFNNNVALQQQERLNTASAGNLTMLLAPRVARFGVKVSF
jgi:hypothetical protein